MPRLAAVAGVSPESSTAAKRSAAFAFALVAMVALAGCTAGDGGGSTAGASEGVSNLPAGITVEFIQQRSDVATREARVMVTNGSDEPLVVTEVAVDDPHFDGHATRAVERTSTIPAGSTTGIRVVLPAVACPARAAEATVVLDYELGDRSGRAAADLPDPLGFVPRLHERECRAVALAQAADVAFTGFTPSAAGEPATLELTVAPTGRATAMIAGIRPTNLLTLATADAASDPLRLDIGVAAGDSMPIVVGIPIVPARCDPHAVQEDKRGTIFPVDVVVEGEPGNIEMFVGEDLRGRILAWVGTWCGFGG
ncbi:hypothetical protein [Microbacterium allomyrinae]|uniref:DUF4232 domain-containing protein n=1 Tax=Microbacterium allomyrinae TaxID=2830666 RepID=A0A9X1S3X8_9MICO|nr:hypothetical protein [Microbacterium allomyrinae]MCC2032458.1 hypothetical protein [Microbacterium allomyrinae]